MSASPSQASRRPVGLVDLPAEVKLLIVRACEESDKLGDEPERPNFDDPEDAGNGDDWVDENAEEDEEEEKLEGDEDGPRGMSVAALALVNKEFYQLCLPVLWRSLDLEEAANPQLEKLLEGVITKRGALVQSLWVRVVVDSNARHIDDDGDDPDAASKWNQTERVRLTGELLQHLPSLTTLDIDVDSELVYREEQIRSAMTDPVLSRLLQPPSVFTLKSLTITAACDDYRLSELLPLRIIRVNPQLEDVTLRFIGGERSKAAQHRARKELDNLVDVECRVHDFKLPPIATDEPADPRQHVQLRTLPPGWDLPAEPTTLVEALAALPRLATLELNNVEALIEASAFVRFSGKLEAFAIDNAPDLTDRALDLFLRRHAEHLEQITIYSFDVAYRTIAPRTVRWLYEQNNPDAPLFIDDDDDCVNHHQLIEYLFSQDLPPYEMPKLGSLAISMTAYTKKRLERWSTTPLHRLRLGQMDALPADEVEEWLNELPILKTKRAAAALAQEGSSATPSLGEDIGSTNPWSSLDTIEVAEDECRWDEEEIDSLDEVAATRGIWLKRVKTHRFVVDSDGEDDDEAGGDEDYDED